MAGAIHHLSSERARQAILLFVGSRDTSVIPLNQMALSLPLGEKRLELIEVATHLFEEPGTLEQVARLATQWFECYLTA